MTLLTQKFSKLVFTFLVVFGACAVLATGSGTIVTQFDLCASTATGTYTGTISRPNTN